MWGLLANLFISSGVSVAFLKACLLTVDKIFGLELLGKSNKFPDVVL
jgi:hypothetical protein